MVDRFDNSEFTPLGEFEEEPEYECIPAGPGIYLGPEFLRIFEQTYKAQFRPAPIEVEAEVIKTEINRPTRGLLEETNG